MSLRSAPASRLRPVHVARRYYALRPWQCVHHRDRSELTAYVEASGVWETVAVMQPTSGISAEELAGFIAGLVNDSQKEQNLLQSAMEALEQVVNEGFNFSSEQAAESVLLRMKKRKL